jgi:hypothetical protein
LSGERAHLLTVEIGESLENQTASADILRAIASSASQLGSGDDGWNALNVWPRRRDVGDLHDLFRAGNSPKALVG